MFGKTIAEIVVILLLVLTGTMYAQEMFEKIDKLYPVDEGLKDPSFKAFREKLLKAIEERDKKFILSIIDHDIRISFGSPEGIKDFKKMWKFDQPESKLWETLKTILSMGGSFSFLGDPEELVEFCAPYVFSQWPDEFDAFEYGAIVGKNVNIRKGPSLNAPIITRLSYDIVRMIHRPEDQEGKWVKMITANGEEGYIYKKYIRSPIDYRACFKKVGDKWIMHVLIAGD